MKALRCLAMLALLAAASVARGSFDTTQPARVRVTVVDEAGRAIAGATVRFERSGLGTPAPLVLTTDGRGEVRAELRCAPKWPEVYNSFAFISVNKAGYAASDSPAGGVLTIFPAAEITRKLVLTATETTLVRFRTDAGEAVPFVRLQVRGSDSPEFADARGEYRYVHARALPPRQLGVQVGGAYQIVPDGDVAEVTLTPVQIANATGGRQIEGNVLLADGRPAVGWRLGWLNTWTTTTKPNPSDRTFFDFSIKVGPVVWLEVIGSNRLVELGRDGSFSIFTNDHDLVLLSPEGIPFRYFINPAAWPAGTHRLTLQIPQLRQTHSGQAAFPDGKPAANRRLTLVQTQVVSQGRSGWLYEARNGTLHPTQPGLQLKTDSAGRYRLPVYAGDDREYAIEGTQLSSGNLERDARVVVSQTPAEAGPKLKHVHLVFRKPNGEPAPEVSAELLRYFGGRTASGQPPYGYPFWTDDREGGHLFVPETTDVLELGELLPGISPFHQTIPLAARDDQTIRVTMPQDLDFKPLRGTLLDLEGNAVAGATVTPTSYYPPPVSTSTRTWGISAKTDENGNFALARVHDEGGLQVDMYAPNGSRILPGWTEAPRFSSTMRDLTIRLDQSGALRVRLPPWAGPPPDGTVSITTPPGNAFSGRYDANYEPGTRTLVAPHVRPGRYTLNWENRSGLPPTPPKAVEVGPGRETVVDLSDANQANLPAPPTQSGLTVLVTRNNQPLVGVAVHLEALPAAILTVGARPGPVQADTSDRTGRAYFRGDAGTTVTLHAGLAGQEAGEVKVRMGEETEIRLELK